MKIGTTILTAARMAAPVFAMNAWEYDVTSGNGHVPDAAEIALLLNYLVDSVMSIDVTPDADGYGEASTGSGRFTVTRVVTPDARSIYISLELADTEQETA